VGAALAEMIEVGMIDASISNANAKHISRLKVFILHLSFHVEIIIKKTLAQMV
jgi:uncharacterized protein (DUF2342 family)